MDAPHNLISPHGRVLGVEWETFWTIVGWLANATFSSRFIVQWYATEKRRQVTVPSLFWWLSLVGSLLFLAYAVCYDKHHVIIFAYAFSWLPYIRNLMIHSKHQAAQQLCECGKKSAPDANFCAACGVKLVKK
ncbi:MAG: hypothetical protein RLZZ350_977 [Verrucomicrobiota bacterium]|jgi:lipid-A-disaccharide synthase-like uncharacterized protein